MSLSTIGEKLIQAAAFIAAARKYRNRTKNLCLLGYCFVLGVLAVSDSTEVLDSSDTISIIFIIIL